MTATVALYERTEALRLVDEWIAEHEEEILAAGGDLTALPELFALLDMAEGDFKDKVERVALKVRELQAEGDAIAVEALRLTNRAASRKRAADSLKEYLKRNMEAAGIGRVDGLLATVAVQKSPPSVKAHSTVNPNDVRAWNGGEWAHLVTVVPESYKLDSRAVVERWKCGLSLPLGVEVQQGTHVRIR